jgi:hypothetical protein
MPDWVLHIASLARSNTRMRSGFERAFSQSHAKHRRRCFVADGLGKHARKPTGFTGAAAHADAEGRQRMAAKAIQSSRRRGATGVERLDVTYRQLRLVAGVQADRGKAIAYQGSRKFLEAEGSDPPAALDQLKQLIDELHERREAGRHGTAPTAEEYLDALSRINQFINAAQQTALIKHAARPGSRASLPQLADQVGVSLDEMRRAYVKLGRYLGDILSFHPERDDIGKPLQPILVLAEPVGEVLAERVGETSRKVEWVLHESLAAAIDSWAS